MKLNLNVPITNLDGSSILGEGGVPITLGKTLAQSLAQDTKGDALKKWSWATTLYAGEELTLDLSDVAAIKIFIENNENFTILLKAQILQHLS